MDNRLEPEYAEAFNGWKLAQNPDTTTKLLTTVQPSIDRAISAHIGQSNPLLKSRARSMALTALGTYDPSRARLGTHLMNQLQGLKRVNRQQQQIVSVPERIVIESGQLLDTENELRDRLGRDPTDAEIADYSGVSRRRLAKVRRYRTPMAEGYYSQMGSEDEDGGGFAPAVKTAPTDHWAELVYEDLDPINQAVMEHSLGMHGRRVLSNEALARRLGLTPSAVSQRKALIQKRYLDQQQSLSPFGA